MASKTAKKGAMANGGSAGITKQQMEEVLANANKNSQVIRIEHAPLVISAIDPKDAKNDTTGKGSS